MAIYAEHDRSDIDAVVDLWRDRCLVGDASLSRPEQYPTCWSAAANAQLDQLFWGNEQPGPGTFESKWTIQLEDPTYELRILAAENLIIYYLFTQTVGQARKIAIVNQTAQTELFTSDHLIGRAFQTWVGNPGSRDKTRQDHPVGYLIDFAGRLKHLPVTRPRQHPTRVRPRTAPPPPTSPRSAQSDPTPTSI